MVRKQFAGNSVSTTLSAGINDSVTTIVLTDGSTFPDGSVGPFVVAFDSGTASEEKVLATARSANTLTGVTRGYDGTVALSHSSGVTATHVLDAVTVNEANAHVNDTTRNDHTQYFPIGAGAWTAYTPTVTQVGAVAVTVGYSKYTRIGKTVIWNFYLAATGAGTAGTGVTITVPVTAAATEAIKGSGILYDVSTTTPYNGTWTGASTTTAGFTGDWSGGNTWGLVPNLALAAGDLIRGHLVYEGA